MLIIDGTYRLTAQRLIPVDPTELLRWLCRPELMTQWISRLKQVKSLSGDPCTPGSRTEITLYTPGRYGALEERFQGRIDEIGPRWLVRTYWWPESSVLSYRFSADEYVRTIAYDLTPTHAGTQLSCEILTTGFGNPKVAGYLIGRQHKSVLISLETLSRVCQGKRGSWMSRFARGFTGDPLAQAL